MKLWHWMTFCFVLFTQTGGSAQDNVNSNINPAQPNSKTEDQQKEKNLSESNANRVETNQQNATLTDNKNKDQSTTADLKTSVRLIDESTPRSKIDLEFDAIEGATKYQIEFKYEAANFTEVYTSIMPEFHVKVPVAKYQVRARAADGRGVYSDWSDPMEVIVSPEAVKFPTNTHFHKKPNPEDLDTSVLVHWQASAQAISYEVVIKKESGEIFETLKVTENEIKLKLPPGKFRVQVIAVGPDEIKNTEPPFEPEIFIEKAKLKTPIFVVNPDDPNDVTLQKMDIGEVNSRLEYQPWMTTEWYFVEEQFNINASAFVPQKKLKPGQYRLFVWLSGEGFEDSDETFRDFVVKPKEQDLN